MPNKLFTKVQDTKILSITPQLYYQVTILSSIRNQIDEL